MMTYHRAHSGFVAVFLTLLLAGCSGKVATFEDFDKPIENVEGRACDPGEFASEDVILSNHVLASDSEGGMASRQLNNGNDELFNDSFNDAFRRIMVGYADRENERPGLRLLFYFNGGLNSQAAVEEQARRQIPCMLNDGYYPMFFVWDTSGFDTYKEQVTRIYDGHHSRSAWVKFLAPFRVGGDALSGLAKAPADYLVHSRRFMRAIWRKPPCYLVMRTDSIKDVTCPKEQIVSFVDNSGKLEDGLAPIDRDRNVVIDVDRTKVDANQTEIARFVQYSALLPVRLISTPFAHGLGESAWNNMLRRTRTTVRRSIEHYLDRRGYHVERELKDGSIQSRHLDQASACPNDLQEKLDTFQQGTGVFARFFELLRRHQSGEELPSNKWVCHGDYECETGADDGDQRCKNGDLIVDVDKNESDDARIRTALKGAKITLVGHSMGAIVINELLSRFPSLPYSDIVVMAAASSIRDTRETLNRYFSQNPELAEQTRFYSLMLHPLNDARERQGLGAVPSGSLLMWIDEMYEVPRVPDDKTFGFWPNAKSARNFFDDSVRDRMLYRVFNRPDPYSKDAANPMEHGDFNNDVTCFWRPAFWGVRNTEWQERYASMPSQALQECEAKYVSKNEDDHPS